MKKLFIVFTVALVTLSLSSCSDDDKNDDKGPGYTFKDQDASGEIDGTVWTYEEGFALVDNESNLQIKLYLPQNDFLCDEDMPDGSLAFFIVPNEVGVYKLTNDLTGFYVNLVDNDFGAHLAKSGAIEIVSITETSVTGRMDVKKDENNYVNGNFTVDFCE
jgi:hypothetical protein